MTTPFHNTKMGHKYYNHDLPRLIESNNKLAAAIEKQNVLNEKLVRLEKKKTSINIDPHDRSSQLY